MAEKTKTAPNKHLTLVVRKRLFGYATNVVLVSNYKKGIEEDVMTTETYYDHDGAIEAANRLSEQLNVKVKIEK